MKLVRPLAITNVNIPTLNINDLSYGFRGKFSCGTQRVVPIVQESAFLPARITTHSARDLIPNHVIIVTKLLALLVQENFDRRRVKSLFHFTRHFLLIEFFFSQEFSVQVTIPGKYYSSES